MTLPEPDTYQKLKSEILRLLTNCEHDIEVLKTCYSKEVDSKRTEEAISSVSDLIAVLEERDCLSENNVHCLKNLGFILNNSEISELVRIYEKLCDKKSEDSCICATAHMPNLVSLTSRGLAQSIPRLHSKLNPLDVRIINRDEWGARDPRMITRLSIPIRHIVICHTNTPNGAQTIETLREIQILHMNKEWDDIGYNFMIGNDGRIYEGRGWLARGAHTKGFNEYSYGLAFLGSFMNITPTSEMLRVAKQLIVYGVHKGFVRPDYEIHGARDITSTLSPGDRLYAVIRSWPHYKEKPSV